MKKILNKWFGISVVDTEYLNTKQDKIELVSCKLKDLQCEKLIPVINESYVEVTQFRLDKDYQRSIEALKNAYFKTLELKQSSCFKCADFFRSMIIESLENIYLELEKLNTGYYRKNHFQTSYVTAGIVIDEIKSHYKNLKLKNVDDRKHFISQYSKRYVS